MKILYVLGKGSKLGNRELRWSLRSVARHGRNVDRVVVAGEDPGFLNPETTAFVPHEDLSDAKHVNIMDCIMAAIGAGLDEEFLYSSDDHLYLRDVDFARYPVYLHGELARERDYPPDRPINKYRRSLLDTRAILEEFGYPAHQFHGHVDTHVDPKYADRVREMLDVRPAARYGYEPTDMFMNAKSAFEDVDCITRRDCKLRQWKGPEDFARRTKGFDCVSYADSAFSEPGPEGFAAFLDAMFPEPCKYEKGGTR